MPLLAGVWMVFDVKSFRVEAHQETDSSHSLWWDVLEKSHFLCPMTQFYTSLCGLHIWQEQLVGFRKEKDLKQQQQQRQQTFVQDII